MRELIMQVLRIRMSFRQAVQKKLKENGTEMTFEMLQVMNCLWEQQGVSQQALALRTAKDKACLTNLINNLEKKGWVARRENPDDGRHRLIYLTKEGDELRGVVRPLIDNIYSECERQIGPEKVKACAGQLVEVYENLNEI